MKMKGISWFERSVDKLVLGLMGVLLVGVVALQVLWQPNRIKVGGGEPVAPQDAMEPVARKANELSAKVNSVDPPTIADPELNLQKRYADSIAKPLVPNQTVVAMGAPTVTQKVQYQGPAAQGTYAAMKIPAPTAPVAATFAGTVHPGEITRDKAVAAIMPTQQPFDKSAVSVQATWSGDALRQAMLEDPDGSGPLSAVPRAWWKSDAPNGADPIAIVAVELEREVVTPAPGSSESPGEVKVVPAMPGRANLVGEWAQRVKVQGDVDPMVVRAQGMREQAERPGYYAMIAGEAWVPPIEMQAREGVDKQRQIRDLQTQRANLQEQIAQLQQQIPAPPAPGQKRDDRPPPPPSGGGAGRGGGSGRSGSGGGGGGGGGSGAGAAPRPESEAEKRNRLVIQLNNLKNKLTSVERQLTRLGVKLDAQPEQQNQTQQTQQTTPLLEDSDVTIWAHDVFATPGSTYRYRVRVVMNNPFFGRTMQPGQESLASESLARGAWSDWTMPVSVEPQNYYAITSASVAGPAAPMPRGGAELFVYYYGQWRKGSVGLDPGDRLETKAKVPELPIYDMAKVAEAFPADAVIDPAAGGAAPGGGVAPPPAGGRDERPAGGGRRPGGLGGGLRGPGGGGAAPAPGGGGAAPAPGGGGGPANVPGANDPKLKEIPTRPGPSELPLRVDAVFLDAVRAVGLGTGGQDEIRAVLRDASGGLDERSPEGDRGSSIYKRLEASVKAAVEAAKAPAGDQPGNVPPPNAPPPPRPGGGRGPGGPAGGGGG